MTIQHLDEIRDRLAIATSVDDVAGAMLQYIAYKRDDVERKPTADPVLLQLLREAFDAINDPDSKVDLRDWTREAKKWL